MKPLRWEVLLKGFSQILKLKSFHVMCKLLLCPFGECKFWKNTLSILCRTDVECKKSVDVYNLPLGNKNWKQVLCSTSNGRTNADKNGKEGDTGNILGEKLDSRSNLAIHSLLMNRSDHLFFTVSYFTVDRFQYLDVN